MLQIIYYILFAIVLVHGLYFGISGLYVFTKNKNKIQHHQPQHKFAVLVASRNEETVIGQLVESLKQQKYPKELYDIIVIPNNCTDETAAVAKASGAKILTCSVPVKSKGDVLKFAFKTYRDSDYDAFIIFDADNVVHPNFLARMNDTICDGYQVAQGFRDSKNPDDNWLSGSYSLFYWTQNLFFNKSRMMMKASASINGTGFMIHKDVINQYGFNTVTLTEDIEFTAHCALNNVQIAFVEDAITYDEQPLEFPVSWKQRRRWSVGTLQCMRVYSGKLLKAYRENHNLPAFDMFMFFLSPVMQLLGFTTMIMLGLFHIFGIELFDVFSYLYAYNVVFLVASYLVTIAFGVFVCRYFNKSVKECILGILSLPLFLFTWIPINIVCLFKKDIVWEPIKHHRNINLEDLVSTSKK